ncbi:MAG: hypothetical protein ACYCO4_00615 [Sulfobacillus sp.]
MSANPLPTDQADLLGDFAAWASYIPWDVRLALCSLLLSMWARHEEAFPDEILFFQQDLLARIAAPHAFLPAGGART